DRCDALVVAEQIALGDSLVRPERLVEVRELELALPTPKDARRHLVLCARPRHLRRVLVLSQPEVRGVAETAVVRPLAVADLSDELRLDPLHVALADARHL